MEEWSDEKLKQFFSTQKARAPKKEEENPKSNQSEPALPASVVDNIEWKKEKVEGGCFLPTWSRSRRKQKKGCFLWKPKCKKYENHHIPFNSDVNDCVRVLRLLVRIW